jgi:hypothetical protein
MYPYTVLQVLHGGENLLDKVEQLKQRSAATKTQLEVAARQQEEQQRHLEQLQLERLDLDAQYSSLEVRAVWQQGAAVLVGTWRSSVHSNSSVCSKFCRHCGRGLGVYAARA